MRALRAAAVAAVVLLTCTPAVQAGAWAEGAPAAPCGEPYLIDREFPNGARWRLCWEMRDIEGLTLTKAVYTPRGHRPVSVLRSTHLAQIHVPYDSGDPRYHDMSGSMGSAAVPLQTQDCPGGERREQNDVPLLCVLPDQPRGIAYLRPAVNDEGLRLSGQGKDLVVFAAFEVGWYTYLAEWRFSDDGSITPRVGATGSLRGGGGRVVSPKHGWPIGVGAADFEESHSHNVFWRTDFDIQGGENDVVEQYDFTGDGGANRTMKRTVLKKETMAKNSRMRWWRVVDPKVENADGHPASWEIVNSDSAEYRGPANKERFTHGDVYVTQYNRCEHLATENAFPPCRKSVDRYVDGQAITDPVVWVGVDFHHVARDEDEDPMPTHWQGFQIRPRDITAKNPY
jgi:primary-amine oxidase